MPRIPRGLVDGFIYHEARKGRKVACPLPPFDYISHWSYR
ncbi:hypothetical protein KsCSTR_47560 [Candidatus Kuenenia stuttgartiensis]|uniref:Uncharacterized protein n=1 Tax=Kuenenia stuttgartiensis TaxID=174633 RepID=A0A6G7GXU4_KUEST|nr:hypothetical protein KsCSTR_47560 [Candidatus Kuenenia stuttgartiensis]